MALDAPHASSPPVSCDSCPSLRRHVQSCTLHVPWLNSIAQHFWHPQCAIFRRKTQLQSVKRLYMVGEIISSRQIDSDFLMTRIASFFPLIEYLVHRPPLRSVSTTLPLLDVHFQSPEPMIDPYSNNHPPLQLALPLSISLPTMQ